MRVRVLALSLLCATAVAQSPYKNTTFRGVTLTATSQTSTPSILSPSRDSYSSGTITLTGVSLTTATFAVWGSGDGGTTYNALGIETCAAPGTFATTQTATAAGCYRVSLAGLDHVEYVTSGTFTATSITLTLSASPNAQMVHLLGPGCCSDNFAGSAGAAPNPAHWTIGAGTWQLTGTGSVQDVAHLAPGDMYWSGNTFTPDQYAQVTINGSISTDQLWMSGPTVRHQAGSDSYYIFIAENGQGLTGIWYVTNSSIAGQLCGASSNTVTSGTVLKLTVVGNLLTAYINGGAVASCSSTNFATGSPGLGSYQGSTGFNTMGSFQAGNI